MLPEQDAFLPWLLPLVAPHLLGCAAKAAACACPSPESEGALAAPSAEYHVLAARLLPE